jgi:hypothetical protein
VIVPSVGGLSALWCTQRNPETDNIRTDTSYQNVQFGRHCAGPTSSALIGSDDTSPDESRREPLLQKDRKMALNFKESLNLSPLPQDEGSAAVLGREFAAKIAAAGGRQQAARAAATAVLARRVDEAPSEHQRLQRLYAQVYRRDELEKLMLNSFDTLGLRG